MFEDESPTWPLASGPNRPIVVTNRSLGNGLPLRLLNFAFVDRSSDVTREPAARRRFDLVCRQAKNHLALAGCAGSRPIWFSGAQLTTFQNVKLDTTAANTGISR